MLLEVGNDYQRAAELGIERAELEPIVFKTQQYRHVLAHMDEARQVLDMEEDLDLRMLAEAEVRHPDPQIEASGDRDQKHAGAKSPTRRGRRNC